MFKKTALLTAALALTAASANAAVVGFGTNLIENGNFEDTAAVAGYSSGAGVAIGGWEDGLTYGATTAGSLSTVTRALTYANDSTGEFVSNTASTTFYPGATSGPLATLGDNYIYSGPGAGLSGMSQTLDLTGNAAVMSAILAGSADYDFDGYFGGWDTQPDQINLEASFRDNSNTEVGSVLIGSVTPADRGNSRDALVYRSAAGTLPTATESIVFTWISGPSMSGSNSGVADNVSFSIVPEPSSLALLGLGGLLVGARRRRSA